MKLIGVGAAVVCLALAAGNVGPVGIAQQGYQEVRCPPTQPFTVCTLSGHTSVVTSVAFSPDGKLLASGAQDNTVKLWEVASGQEVRTLSGHTSYVRSVAFSPDGRLLASGALDQTIKLWEVASGSLVRTLSGPTNIVFSVAFSPDGQLLASDSCGRTDRSGRCIQGEIKLWEVSSGREVRTLSGHTRGVWSVAFSPNGQLLASGANDRNIKLWEVTSGQEVRSLAGHRINLIVSVIFSPDGRLLASGSADQTIKLWYVGDLVGR
ncbi:MAG: WD40 repeat domain-containing protein [Candidatus Bipolaricaulota bacterium]|nr:WD40 repeat domain-containing protein [Candidatus Bipolaricaulota bacterium]MDW8328580.1 WD40 repeat domain-containing protein [Candidatus Bipolaricaulota bacterium]